MPSGDKPDPQPLSSGDVEARIAELDSVPLFMKSLPEDSSENVAISALQSLAHEGTPDEVAGNFKDQGNEYFRGGRYREAVGFYTQGIDAKPEDATLLEALLCNRAACNLELKNYGSVLRDCSKAISTNERCAKAYYRSGLALLALDRVDEAVDCCERCLAFDPSNTGVKTLHERALKAKAEQEIKERETRERLKKADEEKRSLVEAYKARNIIDVPKPDGSSNPYTSHWNRDDPKKPKLVVPVFFLYPQYATSDFIAEFTETTPFAVHFGMMFPPFARAPQWDQNHEYVSGRLAIYAITRRKRLLKIGKKMTLLDACIAARAKDGGPRDGLELKDGCLSFVILPGGTDTEREWVEEFKATRDPIWN